LHFRPTVVQGVILLFDLDGTLLNAGGADRRALLRAFRELCGVDAAVEGVRVHGRTDPEIVEDIFRARLNRPSRGTERQRLYRRYLSYLEEELSAASDFKIMPGVPTLLEILCADSNLALGLATGNIEEAARLKLRRAGLDAYFRFGAFGSDVADRAALLKLAALRGKGYLPAGTRRVQVVVIGDTTLDIAAGKQVGAVTVAVATGGDPLAALEAAAPDYLLPDFSHSASFPAILEAVRGRPEAPVGGHAD
jgi:phosphoglycolate phosphatase-like HAD superfamily hydrolase